MPQKLFNLLFLVCSLVSCQSGPKITVCVMNGGYGILDCVDPDQKQFQIPVSGANNYVCLSPPDMKEMIDWCEAKKNGTK